MSNSIYRYTPVITEGPFGTDLHPVSTNNDTPLTELCQINNVRYVSVPENVEVSVPEEIIDWEAVIITDELREAIKTNSPLCQLIAQRVIEQIRNKYPLDEELYFARISVGNLQGTYEFISGEQELLQQYQIDVEAAREWGRQERTQLGL